MQASKKIKREAKRLFQRCLVNGLLEETRVRRLAESLIRSKRRAAHAFLSQFLRLVKLDRLRHSARVESAAPLAADLQASVVADLDRVYGPGLSSLFVENPALIGGMRIKVASDVYDGSVKARLAALERGF